MKKTLINALATMAAALYCSAAFAYPVGTLDMNNASKINLGSTGVRMSTDGDGAITWLSLGNGFLEDITMNLDDTTNTAVFTSSTGLNVANFSGISLQESGNNVISDAEIDTSSELKAIVTDETGSGALVFATSPTLGTPVISDYSSAQHDHSNAANGGNIPEGSITDGSILARVGANETISGSWTFPSNNPPSANTTTRQSIAKAYGTYSSGTLQSVIGYNVSLNTSTVQNPVTINFTTDFANTQYACVFTATGNTVTLQPISNTRNVGSMVVAYSKPDIADGFDFICFGDQ